MDENTLHNLKGLAALVPGKPTESTLWRWCCIGLLRDGERVTMQHERSGVRIFSSLAWWREFQCRLSPPAGDDPARRRFRRRAGEPVPLEVEL